MIANAESSRSTEVTGKPNILLIFADDLGYGDVSCLNPGGKIPTPNMDRLGREGMICTDAHSSSAVCTPSRYGILTGRYNWRSEKQAGICWIWEGPMIEPETPTVGQFLQAQGYHTACIGKWHLGQDWQTTDGEAPYCKAPDDCNVAFDKPLLNGPVTRGFDEYFGTLVPNFPPYGYVENDRFQGEPTAWVETNYMKSGPRGSGPMGLRAGPAVEGWDFRDILPDLTRRAVDTIDRQAAGEKPFFLYLALTSPHTPIVPTEAWVGRSGLNPYADWVMQTDHAIGQVLDALDRNRIADNTLVVIASDNGCAPEADFVFLQQRGHQPSYRFRGHKADIYEGGHRIPLLMRYPKEIAAGTTCEQTVCLTDFMATCADVIGAPLPDQAGVDSFSLRPLFTGQGIYGREATVHHSINGGFSIRRANWKLEFCPGSDGWTYPAPKVHNVEGMPVMQLYDLSADVGERTNVIEQHPHIVAALTAELEMLVQNGRSTPGPKQRNNGKINIRRGMGVD